MWFGDRTTDSPGAEPEIKAIIVPNLEYFALQGLNAGDKPLVEGVLRKEAKERGQKLAAFKRITKLVVQHEELEKTTTRKVKRYLYAAQKRNLRYS